MTWKAKGRKAREGRNYALESKKQKSMLCNIVLYIVLAVDTIISLSNIHVRIPIMDDTISSFYFNVHMKVLPKNWDTIKIYVESSCIILLLSK